MDKGILLITPGGGADLDPVTVTDPWDVAAGKVIVDKDGNPLTGTLTERGAWGSSVGMNGRIVIPAGRHNGGGCVDGPVITQRGAVDKTINCGQNYNNGAGYYDSIIVTAASLASQTGGATAEDGYVYNGKTYWKNGVKRTGNMAVNSLLSFSAAAYGGKQILLKWQNPYAATGKPFSGVEIRYSTGGYPGAGGTVIYTGAGNNTAPGGWSQVVVTMPAFGTGYYFSARPYATTSLGTLYGAAINGYAATAAELWLTFTSSQSYVIPAGYSNLDIFAVGGGGGTFGSRVGENGNGAGGGYTQTVRGVAVSVGQTLDIIVGLGGYAINGSASSVSRSGAILSQASGGYRSSEYDTGSDSREGNGGSGGGCRSLKQAGSIGGRGGSDGSNGYACGSTDTSGGLHPPGAPSGNPQLQGQRTSTRAWGTGTLYGPGGGGGSYNNKTPAGAGGSSGGGNGTNQINTAGANGAANTGGGAGGCGKMAGDGSLRAHATGGSGIVLLHVY